MNGSDLALGQLFLMGFAGLAGETQHPVVEAVTRHGLGGVILFDRDFARRQAEYRIPGAVAGADRSPAGVCRLHP